jgi:hypothetical protein
MLSLLAGPLRGTSDGQKTLAKAVSAIIYILIWIINLREIQCPFITMSSAFYGDTIMR